MTLSRSLTLGYHGCDREIADALVNGSKTPDPGRKSHHWLGPGVYFWEESPSRARRWAEEGRRRGALANPAVVGAVIDMGHCLNLIDMAHLDLVKTAHETYVKACATAGFEVLKNKGPDLAGRFLDHAVFETLHRMRQEQGEEPFDTIRAFFIEGGPLYPDAGLRALDHVQVCVRNPRKILGFFHVRDSRASARR